MRGTHICCRHCIRRRIKHPSTNNAYVSQRSDTRARWLKHVYRHWSVDVQIRKYAIAWKESYYQPCRRTISVEERVNEIWSLIACRRLQRSFTLLIIITSIEIWKEYRTANLIKLLLNASKGPQPSTPHLYIITLEPWHHSRTLTSLSNSNPYPFEPLTLIPRTTSSPRTSTSYLRTSELQLPSYLELHHHTRKHHQTQWWRAVRLRYKAGTRKWRNGGTALTSTT